MIGGYGGICEAITKQLQSNYKAITKQLQNKLNIKYKSVLLDNNNK